MFFQKEFGAYIYEEVILILMKATSLQGHVDTMKCIMPLLNLLMYSKNIFRQGVCNDGGSHVETSSICAVPLLLALYRLVVSSITWGSQAQPLYNSKYKSVFICLGDNMCQGIDSFYELLLNCLIMS